MFYMFSFGSLVSQFLSQSKTVNKVKQSVLTAVQKEEACKRDFL